MFLEASSRHYESNPGNGLACPSDRSVPVPSDSPVPSDWTVVIPFFNEAGFLPATLRSLAAQTVASRLVLVDNGSTDGSGAVARAECRRLGLGYTLIHESRPGKVQALATGLAAVRTRFVATFDADTVYPADYLERAGRILRAPGVVAAGAYYAGRHAPRWRRLAAGVHICAAGLLLPRQCHAGGAGQAFHTASLRAAGGFDPALWNLVLEDHEVIHRLQRLGRIGYDMGFWCSPSERERDRESIRWNLVERLAYHLTPVRRQHRFFHDFLAPRLLARQLSSERIRERPYQHLGTLIRASSHSLCG